MSGGLEARMLRLLRVPPAPRAPAGEEGSLRRFHAAPAYLRYRQVVWGLRQVAALAGLVLGLFFVEHVLRLKAVAGVRPWIVLGEALAWAAYVVQLPFGLYVVGLDFRHRWYLVTDRGLRVREGVLTVKEKTMTFANVQELSLEQGPLQRLLGVADVRVRSAGGGADKRQGQPGHEPSHEARLRGLGNAREVADHIREAVRLHRDTGLGEASVVVSAQAAAPVESSALEAARELLAEVRALRAAGASPSPSGSGLG